MTRYWIDVEDADGKRLGSGPIITATGWECTRLLDRVGTFRFAMPATDPKADLLQVKRYVRCWGIRDGALAELGGGVIEQAIIGNPTNPQLQVSGSDFLRELAYRSVGDMWLADEVIEHAHRVAHVVVGPSYAVEMPECTDYAVGDTTTYATLTHEAYNGGEYLYIGHMRQFDTIHFAMKSCGIAPSTAWRIQVFDTADFGWKDVTIEENTTIYLGQWLRQSGFIRFSIPDNWGLEGLTHGPLYDVRISSTDNTMTDMQIWDIAVGYTRPTTRALEMIAAKFPANWALDDINGYTSTQAPQATGAELIVGGGFEVFTGTADDSTTDTFTGWINAGTDANNRIEAWTASGGMGAYNARIQAAVTGTPYLYQDMTVTPYTDYVLAFQCKGDGGTGQIIYRLKDNVTGRYLSYHIYTMQTAAAWVDYSYRLTVPPECTSLRVELSCTVGAARIDSVSLVPYIGGEVYLELAGESDLEALNRLAEQTGEHFILSYSGRRVLWLGFDERRAGVKAINGGNALAQQGNPAVAQISNLTEQQDAYDLVSRVYVYGGDTGSNRLSLAGSTRSVPAGYVLNTADNYIERTGCPYPLIEKPLEFTDVSAADTTTNAIAFSANMLVDRAQQWLETHSATDTDRLTGNVPRAYALELVGCQRPLYPGHMLAVNYIQSRDGVTLQRLITDLWIMSVTEQIDANGIPTTALEVATVDALARTDAEALVNEARINRALRRRTERPRTEAGGLVIVTHPTHSNDHAGLSHLAYADALHTGFEPTVTKGNLTALDNKVVIGGTGTGALIGAGATVGIVSGNIAHGDLGGLTTGDPHTQYLLKTASASELWLYAEPWNHEIIFDQLTGTGINISYGFVFDELTGAPVSREV
jgi:hypothetical protein